MQGTRWLWAIHRQARPTTLPAALNAYIYGWSRSTAKFLKYLLYAVSYSCLGNQIRFMDFQNRRFATASRRYEGVRILKLRWNRDLNARSSTRNRNNIMFRPLGCRGEARGLVFSSTWALDSFSLNLHPSYLVFARWLLAILSIIPGTCNF